MEERQNPNSHKHLRREDTLNSWSELPRDLLLSVFERLSCANFQRAKSVCRFWQFVSRQCVPKGQIHWMILFPKDKEYYKNSSCMFFNPEEKHKLYKTQNLGVDFAKSFCIATYGSWLLMELEEDPMFNLYIMNIFTRERIDLPSIESQLGMVKVERTIDGIFIDGGTGETTKGWDLRSPVFWIDEKTKDYIVIWALSRWCVVYAKKGDTLWNQIPETSRCFQMVYKDHKLCFLSYYRHCKIFDISGEISPQILQLSDCHLPKFKEGSSKEWSSATTKLVFTVGGDVLWVERKKKRHFYSFRVWKVYSSGLFKKYEKVKSLCDEAMLFDLGITVPANETDGLERNSIYFSGGFENNTNDIFIFNLETENLEQLDIF